MEVFVGFSKKIYVPRPPDVKIQFVFGFQPCSSRLTIPFGNAKTFDHVKIRAVVASGMHLVVKAYFERTKITLYKAGRVVVQARNLSSSASYTEKGSKCVLKYCAFQLRRSHSSRILFWFSAVLVMLMRQLIA